MSPADKRQWAQLQRAVQKNDYTEVAHLLDTRQHEAEMFVSSLGSFDDKKEEINFGAISFDWARQAAEFYNTVPELASAVDLAAKSISSCNLRIGYQNFQGDLVVKDDDPELNALLRGLRGEGGDFRQIMYQAAVNLQVTGDGFLIAEPIYDDNGASITRYENWEFVSVFELTKNTKKQIVRDFTGGVKKHDWQTMNEFSENVLDEHYYVSRVWRRSPWHSQLADSPVRKNLPILKILSKLLDLTNAIANTQLSAGILKVPEELSLGPYDATISETEKAEDQVDPLTKILVEYLALPVEDRGSAASLAPLVFRGKAEYLKEVDILRLGRDMDTQTRLIREELLERLARGLGMPASMVQDVTGLSHWSANSVQQQFANNTCGPLGQMIADFLTRCYLWPMLKKRIKEGHSSKHIEDIEHWRFIFDPAHIMARVDKGTQALRAFEHGILSEEAVRTALGFTEVDARTVAERRQAIIFDLIKASPKTLAPCLAPLIDGLESIVDCMPEEGMRSEDSPSELPANEDGRGDGQKKTPERTPGDTSPPDEDKRDADPSPGGPDEDRRDPDNSRLSSMENVDELIAQLSQLSHMYREHAIQEASNRVDTLIRSDQEHLDLLGGRDPEDTMRTLAAEGGDILGLPLAELTDKAFDSKSMTEQADIILNAWLRDQQLFDQSTNEIISEIAATALMRSLMDFIPLSLEVGQTRYDNQLSVPSALVESVLEKTLGEPEF